MHLAQGTGESRSRRGPEDVHFHSCIWNKTMGCFFKQFHTFCSKPSPSISPSTQIIVSKQGQFHTMHLCSLSGSIWCSMRHLNITADTVSKRIKFLAQKQWQRLKACQNKSHSSLPSKWTRFNLHPPIFQRRTQGTQFIFADYYIKCASPGGDCIPTATLTSSVFLQTFTNIRMLIHDSPTYHLPSQMVTGGMLILS